MPTGRLRATGVACIVAICGWLLYLENAEPNPPAVEEPAPDKRFGGPTGEVERRVQGRTLLQHDDLITSGMSFSPEVTPSEAAHHPALLFLEATLERAAKDRTQDLPRLTRTPSSPFNAVPGVITVDAALRRVLTPDQAKEIGPTARESLADFLLPINQELHRLAQERSSREAENFITNFNSGYFLRIASEDVNATASQLAEDGIVSDLPSDVRGQRILSVLTPTRNPDVFSVHNRYKDRQKRVWERIRLYVESIR